MRLEGTGENTSQFSVREWVLLYVTTWTKEVIFLMQISDGRKTVYDLRKMELSLAIIHMGIFELMHR